MNALLSVNLRAAGHVWMRNLTVYRKTFWTNILPNFFEPMIYLVAMGIGLGAYITRDLEGFRYIEYIVPGLITASAMNGGSFETTYNVFVKMHFGKIYQAVTATPVSFEDAMMGEVLWGVSRGFVYGSIFALVVAAFGLMQGWTGVFVLPVVLLTAWLFASIGLLFTSWIKVIDMYSFYYTIWLTPLFLFSGIFFPVSGLPAWARTLAWFTPLFHCVNLSKAAVHGRWASGNWIDLAWIVAVAFGANAWAIARVRNRMVR